MYEPFFSLLIAQCPRRRVRFVEGSDRLNRPGLVENLDLHPVFGPVAARESALILLWVRGILKTASTDSSETSRPRSPRRRSYAENRRAPTLAENTTLESQ